jgi:hypothetical protein
MRVEHADRFPMKAILDLTILILYITAQIPGAGGLRILSTFPPWPKSWANILAAHERKWELRADDFGNHIGVPFSFPEKTLASRAFCVYFLSDGQYGVHGL